jgi:hypothetical protein
LLCATTEISAQKLLIKHEKDSMSTLKYQPLTAWSFEGEDETALTRYIEELFVFAPECSEHPGEESVAKACGAARHVWDTAEGMIHANVPIDPDLLTRAIYGIGKCIEAASQMRMPPAISEDVANHIRQMISAMGERRDDLSVLLKEGKMSFLHRLRASRLAAA